MIIMLDAYVYVSLCVQPAQVVHVFLLKSTSCFVVVVHLHATCCLVKLMCEGVPCLSPWFLYVICASRSVVVWAMRMVKSCTLIDVDPG